ncbi:MAG: hypothetical protein IJZ67_09170 [Alistipes sp.]|nr:hypothetical protein [Alistipes sp.]
MKVIRVKAKVATKPVVEDAAFWKRAAEQNAELAKQIAAELDIEKKNHALATAGVQMWQRIANENEADARNWKARADAAVKAKRDAEDLGMRAANDLAARLVKAMDEADAAREEANDLRLELMERGVRIEELERRIEWLQAHSDTGADFVS